MKNKIEISAAAGMVPSRGLRRRRVFGILSAMGLMSATALIGAERVSNSFVTVEGDGVRIADDGSIHFPNAKSPVAVEVTARPGWKVNGRKSLSLVRSPGDNRSLSVTSDLGEDSDHVPLEDCQFDSVVSNAHVVPPAISIEGGEGLIYMYALPESNVLVSASASCETVSNGVHEVTTTWLPCPVCHAAHDPESTTNTISVAPGAQIWMASAAGVETNSNAWTGYMTKGRGQQISFHVLATNDCSECICEAATNVVVDVHELSITNDLYIGIDRTDAGWTNPVANAKTATARIDPMPSGTVLYTWTECGICSFTGRTDQATVRYFAPNPDAGSTAHLAEPLTVAATITNEYGLGASATCTTNFTVVKVDVKIADVGEDKEETEGAFVPFVPDSTNGLITVEGTNQMQMAVVTFSCEPTDLPTNEVVTITSPGPGELYEELTGGELVLITATNYPACEIANHKFFLHGHGVSVSCSDGLIEIGHPTSGAKDIAKYTCFSLQFITPAGDPVAYPIDSGAGQNEFTYSEANPGVLTMNLKASVSPIGYAALIRDDCRFSVDPIGDSTMAWDASNPDGVPTVSENCLIATVTFTGLPKTNSDFGKKKASISCRGAIYDQNDYEVFFAKIAKNHPPCSTCPGCSNWFYYWREGNVCSIPNDAIWREAEGENADTFGWHEQGVVYLTDLAAGKNSDAKTLTASFSITTSCIFRIEKKACQFPELLDVRETSIGEKGYSYSVEEIKLDSRPEVHEITGIGGDGKGVGCVAQCAVHELRHKVDWQSQNEANALYDALVAARDKMVDDFGWDSIETAYAELKVKTFLWSSGDRDGDRMMDRDERGGGDTGILSDTEDCDTYDFAQYFKDGTYGGCGDQEIRARAVEPTAVYHVELDWSNPGCQYSDVPYGPKK